MEKELEILYAKPIDEPDQAKVKWPKVKKWVRPRGRTIDRKKNRQQPGTKEAREILEDLGRSLTTCDDCESEDVTCHIHHKDRNPYNNDSDNLLVLCKFCHATRHQIADSMGVKPWYVGTIRTNEELW